jgi:hypothetical protein
MRVIKNILVGLLILSLFLLLLGVMISVAVDISTVARGWVAVCDGFFLLCLASIFLFMSYLMGQTVIRALNGPTEETTES